MSRYNRYTVEVHGLATRSVSGQIDVYAESKADAIERAKGRHYDDYDFDEGQLEDFEITEATVASSDEPTAEPDYEPESINEQT